MTDPLKLPLRIMPGFMDTERWCVVDADNQPVVMTKHRARIIVAALTADAEKGERDG